MANPNDPFTSPGPAPKSGGGGSGWLIALVVIILAIVSQRAIVRGLTAGAFK